MPMQHSPTSVPLPSRPATPADGRVALDRVAQKKLGAFYTPTVLSDILVEWAIQSSHDTVLEPGFGGCGFIESALSKLEAFGCPHPASQLFGCDIDDGAFDVLRSTLPVTVVEQQFPKQDFLHCTPGLTWPEKFVAAVGNPPYVSYQTLGATAREHHQRVLHASGFADVSARASLWAYFVLHATSFLLRGGRLAWVLPGSFMQAHYAQPVRAHLGRLFQRLFVARVHDRLFKHTGADEETVVVLAEGYGLGTMEGASSTFRQIDTLADLREAIAIWQRSDNVEVVPRDIDTSRTPARPTVPATTPPVPTRKLGEIVRLKIGLVTGDNSFFVLSTAEAKARGLRLSTLRRVLSKFSMIRGVALTDSDLDAALDDGARGWLVTSPQLPSSSVTLTRYLGTYPEDKLASVATFKKRKYWHSIDDGRPPDAFWPVMRDLGPVLVLNRASVNCTNTIHRAYCREGVSDIELLLALLGVASTYGQLSAEICGRHYGSGVLKHEPREAEAIELPWANVADADAIRAAVSAGDISMRLGNAAGFRDVADEFFIAHTPGYTRCYVEELEAILREARSVRMPKTRRMA